MSYKLMKYNLFIFQTSTRMAFPFSKISDNEQSVKFDLGFETDETETNSAKSDGQGEQDDEKTPMNSPPVQPSPASPRLKYGSSDSCLSPKRQLFQPRLFESLSSLRKSDSDLSEGILQVLNFLLGLCSEGF